MDGLIKSKWQWQSQTWEDGFCDLKVNMKIEDEIVKRELGGKRRSDLQKNQCADDPGNKNSIIRNTKIRSLSYREALEAENVIALYRIAYLCIMTGKHLNLPIF